MRGFGGENILQHLKPHTMITGELEELLLKGAQIISVWSDNIEPNNRLLVKMPAGILADDKREIKFTQFQKELNGDYWAATTYYCGLTDAKKLFRKDVQDDRIMLLAAKENKEKYLK